MSKPMSKGQKLAVATIIVAMIAIVVPAVQIQRQSSVQRQQNALMMAKCYLEDPIMFQLKGVINSRTKNGTDYSSVPKDPELLSAVRYMLNHLETDATAVEQGVVGDDEMREHFYLVYRKFIEVHLNGRRIEGVVAANPKPFGPYSYPNMVRAYERWSLAQ